jgi:hypothetical protein
MHRPSTRVADTVLAIWEMGFPPTIEEIVRTTGWTRHMVARRLQGALKTGWLESTGSTGWRRYRPIFGFRPEYVFPHRRI